MLGKWKITVLCGSSGSATASLLVARRTQPPAPTPARITVEKSGFNFDDRFGTRQATYGIVLRNSSPDEDALDVQVTVNIVDASSRTSPLNWLSA